MEQITFSGEYAASKGLDVLYVTEKVRLQAHSEGLELIEIAPGIDLEKDILEQMDFKLVINKPPKLMDSRIFYGIIHESEGRSFDSSA